MVECFQSEGFHHEVIGSLSLCDGEGVEFANLGYKGFIKIDGVVEGSQRGNMVGGFFGEDLSEFGIFSEKGFLGLGCFGLHSKIGGHGQLVNGCHSLEIGKL